MSTEAKKLRSSRTVSALDGVLSDFKIEYSSNLFFKRDAYLDWLEQDTETNICSLFTSGTSHGIKTNSFSVPREFANFTIKRDKNHKVSEITDGTSTLQGFEVASIAVTEQVNQLGFEHAYLSMAEPKWILGHKDVMLEKFEYAKSSEEVKSEAIRIFSYGVNTACYATPFDILMLLKNEGVKVEDYKAIAIAASTVAKEGIKLDELDLSTPELLSSQLKKSDAAAAVQSLSQVLFASHLKDMSFEKQVLAFQANPSARLAGLLEFKMPTRLSLVHTSNKAEVVSIEIEKLHDDDEIILSNVNITGDFYSTVSHASQVQVITMVKGLSIKNKSQKCQPLKTADTMKKRDYLSILTAIEEDNKATGARPTSSDNVVQLGASEMTSFFQS